VSNVNIPVSNINIPVSNNENEVKLLKFQKKGFLTEEKGARGSVLGTARWHTRLGKEKKGSTRMSRR
jgi:hypothetical protein